ncbi:hypothetical protein CAL18_16075 [Bordetella genomosp. 7]|jgi:uncharacterized protein (TIGR02246 family)|uniref:SnoaL-like domain-containing protein n=1 Tax=Bordetella genomosp. 7 TaxID=1416805 RepID=A0A261QTY6_9BORD|nr:MULTISPECIES: nuclear transport factor 2 family protein [Bordetella]OZI16259.1 hypothetical protein CAL19_16330 [Bordetella genomosp. 7]OZI16965.1 hypothetical protein CAL18_16075 [Bordetella genomosp. 7]
MNTPDTNALASVVCEFFSALDTRNHEQAAALMARDGTWVRQGAELKGRDAVLKALEQRDPQRATAHVVSNLRVESAEPGRARVRFYMTAYETRPGVSVPQLLGIRDSTDDLVYEDGAWRIWRKDSRRVMPPE